jgi:hypothetical protein
MGDRVYKYRGVALLDRDLDALASDKLYAPTAAQLNDPSEAVLSGSLATSRLRTAGREVRRALDQLEGLRHSVGIYSLSRVATDELMWAHYADSHNGYCIEYDLARLTLDARAQWSVVDVVYSDGPPTIELSDLLDAPDERVVTTKLVGHKSRRWAYENEVRIVTARSGFNAYARAAVTGVYFGCRCSEDTERAVRHALRERRVEFFRLGFVDKSYQLRSECLPRIEADGEPRNFLAPVESDAIPSEGLLGPYAHLLPQLIRAVESVRRDPSCGSVVYADVNRRGANQGRIFVQFRTTVVTDLDPTVTWYFDADGQ